MKIKFAVVGCGHIGKRHAELITKNMDAELVALCDVKERSALQIDQYPVPFFSSPDFLLNNVSDLDVVNICTPNGLHAGHTMLALHHDKHVVIEKPMALKKDDCAEIISLANKKGKKIFCVMQNRYSSPAVWLKEMIDKNIPGKIYIVNVNCYWNRDERYYTKDTWHGKKDLDGGTLFTQFSHFIDMLYWLFGDIKNISAQFADFSHQQLTAFEDTGLLHFTFENGALGSFHYSTSVNDKNFESSITIIAEKGTIRVGGQYMEKVLYCDIKDYTMPVLHPVSPANDYGTYKGSAANHHFIIENVIDTLRGKTKVATTAEEGMKVVDMIERIYTLRPPHVLKDIL
ncbi:MAG: Gfo/Idh/MocA family oxidoreductase [Chitinophagales bacterium]|nr:Gfo/Idh/MocA family oxidoreductase [Chitinophagales bacterium]